MKNYLLGVLTTPLAALILFGLFAAWIRLAVALEHRGLTVEARLRRGPIVSNHTLTNDIWWERSWGPVFAGGWYRELEVWGAGRDRRINRWVGVGHPDGPCIIAIRSRRLAS